MSVDDMFKQFKSDIEKNEYLQAQMSTIAELQRKNKKLQEELNALKEQVKLPAVPKAPQVSLLSDEEETAQNEIKRLRERSYEKELTLEEAKKLEIYSKILIAKNKKEGDPGEREVKEMQPDALLALVEGKS